MTLVQKVAAFLKVRDEEVLPEETSDEERLASANEIAGIMDQTLDIPAPAGGEEAAKPFIWLREHDMRELAMPASKWRDGVRIYRDPSAMTDLQPLYAHPAPDHHLRVDVERLRAEQDVSTDKFEEALQNTHATICKDHPWPSRELEMVNRVTGHVYTVLRNERAERNAAETRIAKLDAVARTVVDQFERTGTLGDLAGTIRALRSALASSNKPVEERR